MHTMAQKVYHISESFVAFETFKYERANDVKAISDNILKFDCEKCGKTNPDENCKYFEVLSVINVKLNATWNMKKSIVKMQIVKSLIVITGTQENVSTLHSTNDQQCLYKQIWTVQDQLKWENFSE